MNARHAGIAPVLCLSCLALAATPSLARTLYWNGSADNQWATAANWSDFDATTGTITPAATGPSTGDVVVLVGGKSFDPSDQNIPNLVVDGIWFGPNADTVTVGTTNGSTLGINADGAGAFETIDLAGAVWAKIEFASTSTTVIVDETMLDESLGAFEAKAFLLAVEPGTTLARGALEGAVIDSVDPDAGTFELTAVAGADGDNQSSLFPAQFEFDLPVELHGSNGSYVEIIIGDEATTGSSTDTIDAEFSANAANDLVGLCLEDTNAVPGGWPGQVTLTLTNPNSDFLGPLRTSTVNAGINFTSIADAGVASAAGAGDTVLIDGGGGNRMIYSGGSTSTNRTLQFSGGARLEQTDGGATVDWTGEITTGSGGGTAELRISGTWNQIGDISGSRDFQKNTGGTINLTGAKSLTGDYFHRAGTTTYDSIADIGVPSAIGAGSRIFLPRFTGGSFTYAGTGAASTNRPIETDGDNTRPTFRNSSADGSPLAFTGGILHSMNAYDFREVGFDADTAEIAVTGTRVVFGDGNGGFQVDNAPFPVTFFDPGSGHGRNDVDGHAIFPATNLAHADVAVTAVTAVPGVAYNQGAVDDDVTLTVSDASNLEIGMLAIHPNLLNQGRNTFSGSMDFGIRTNIVAISGNDVTLSAGPINSGIAINDTIEFIGYRPYGFDYLDVSGSGVLQMDALLGNASIDGENDALTVGGSGVVSGNGGLVPWKAGQIVNFQGNSTLAPGSSIGSIQFGTTGEPLLEFDFDGTLEIEVDGPNADMACVWATTVFLSGSDITVDNIGAGPPDAGTYVILENKEGTSFTGSPNTTLNLVGDFTDRLVELVTESDRLLLEISFTNSPEFTSPASVQVANGVTGTFHTFSGTDPDAGTLTYTIEGGDDASLFSLGGTNGEEIAFLSPPDFGNPADTDGNNAYELFVKATSSVPPNKSATQAFSVTVVDGDAPAIVTQPLSMEHEVLQMADFTIGVSGSPVPDIQWQVSTDGGATWTDLAGETSATLSFSAVAWGQDGDQYRAVVSNSQGTVISDVATLGVFLPPVSPTFPNDQTLTPGQLLFRQVGLGRVTNIEYHNGFVYTHNVGGGALRRFEWADSTDAGSFFLASTDVPGFSDLGTHGHSKIGDWVAGGGRPRIKRDGVNVNVNEAMPADLWFQQGHPNAGEHKLFYPWTLPFNWAYGSHIGQTFIIKEGQQIAEWNALSQHGVSGHSIIMGDLLFIISDQSSTGVAVYDLTPVFQDPPAQPALLDKLSGNFGAYIPVMWENYIVFARNNGTKLVEIVDWSDPTDLRFVGSVDLAGTPELDGNENVPYVQAQDNYIFARHHKINMDTLQVELELDQVGNNRPAGSVPGELETSQYLLPVGQFLITGSYSFAGKDGVGVWVHQAEPDTRQPYVGYHRPRPGQTNFPLGAPISLLVHETLESFTIINGETVIVRPVGGEPIDCYISNSYDDVITITPKQELSPNTTYEVEVLEGGIKDAAGNGIEGYTFTFSTGSDVVGGNLPPEITSFTAAPLPAAPGDTLQLTALATDPEDDDLEYKFSFGDGTPSTGWVTTNIVSHQYVDAGHYELKVQVRDLDGGGSPQSTVVETLGVPVVTPLTGPFPTKSTSLALDEAERRVFVVNPDADSLTMLDADTKAKQWEVPTAADPRSVALGLDGEVWVACHDAGAIEVRDGETGALLKSFDTGYGSAPIRIAATPDRSQVFATLQATGELIRFNAASQLEDARITLGPWAHAIAIHADASKLLVSRFISPEHFGIIWEVTNNPGGLSLTDTIELYRDRGDRGRDDASSGAGVPNHVASITISPDGGWAWYTAKKDNTQRGEYFDLGTGTNEPLEPDHTVRALVGRIDLAVNDEPNKTGEDDDTIRLDVDNAEGPTDVVFSPAGDYALVTMRGNNLLAVYDRLDLIAGGSENTIRRLPVGNAPNGAILDPATNRLWVQNYMSRDVSVHELNGFFTAGDKTVDYMDVATVATEPLDPVVLRGKQIFYDAGTELAANSLEKMSLEAYMSCATCHLDGGTDNRTFDFTQRGEGLRNTIDLRGRSGTGHGNVHWTANFDEIQDFENDIRLHFGGAGFMTDADFAATIDPLGAPKAGLSSDQDALAAYVTSLDASHLPASPHRNSDGTMTAAAIAGAAVFSAQNCASCHDPADDYQNSESGAAPTLFDVGTIRTSSGDRIDGPLTGLDTPTLLSLWNTAPYFHDGSAETLEGVFTVAGGEVVQIESGALAGGAGIPGFISINQDSSCHGEMVSLSNSPGATATLASVDGGTTSGNGALEIRYTSGNNGSFNVTVQSPTFGSTNYVVPVQNDVTRLEWKRFRIEGVPLQAGPNNTIIFESTGTGVGLDDVTVSTVDTLAQADAHRRVIALPQLEQDQLLAYLLQLDGQNAAGEPLPPYESWADTEGLDGTPGKEDDFEANPDGDPFPNGLEWILGGDPLEFDSFASLMQMSGDATDGLVLSFTRREESKTEASLFADHSNDLWNSDNHSMEIGPGDATDPTTGVDVDVTDNGTDPDDITVTIPHDNASPDGSLFGKIRAEQNE